MIGKWYSCVHASSLPFVSLLVHCPVGAKAKVIVLNSSRTSCVEILFIEKEEAIFFSIMRGTDLE